MKWYHLTVTIASLVIFIAGIALGILGFINDSTGLMIIGGILFVLGLAGIIVALVWMFMSHKREEQYKKEKAKYRVSQLDREMQELEQEIQRSMTMGSQGAQMAPNTIPPQSPSMGPMPPPSQQQQQQQSPMGQPPQASPPASPPFPAPATAPTQPQELPSAQPGPHQSYPQQQQQQQPQQGQMGQPGQPGMAPVPAPRPQSYSPPPQQ